MPIYEYRCEKCGQQFEVIQKFSDEPLQVCGSCQGRLAKLISQTSFQFKGTGWYVTDYAGKSEAKSQSKNGESASKPAADSKSSAESKPSAESKSSVEPSTKQTTSSKD